MKFNNVNIKLVQTNQVLYDKSAAEYKVEDALEKGDIWQIGVDIAVNSERTTCDVILSYAPLQAFVFLALVLAVRWTSPDRPLQ